MEFPILSTTILVPLLGVILILFLPKDNEKLIKRLSIIISLIPLACRLCSGWAMTRPPAECNSPSNSPGSNRLA